MRFLQVLFFLLCFLPFNMKAQEKVVVSGDIIDETGVPVIQALVLLEGTSFGAYSNEKGTYSLRANPGKYTITVTVLGYKTIRQNIDITSNKKQDFVLKEEAINLSVVEVYGKAKSRQMKEGSFSMNSIDIKPIASGLNNLSELVGRSSGVKIKEEGGVGSDFDLSINGMSGNSIRYFIDGVPLSFIGNGMSLANLPVNIIDRIDVYKGVVPAELGADALGGAINIITKKEVRNYLDVSYGMGSFNTHKADLNAQYSHKETGFFLRPTFGINYSKNNYLMKGVEVWTPSSSEFERIDTKRFHDDYFSLLAQLSAGFINTSWADFFSVSASYSLVNKELQTGAVQSVVYGDAERKSDAYNISLQYRKKKLFTENLSTSLSLSHTQDYSIVTDTAYRKYRWDGSFIESSRNEITGRGRTIRHIERPLTIGRAYFDYFLNDQHSLNINYLLNHIQNTRFDDVDAEFERTTDVFGKHITGLSYKQSFWADRLNNSLFVKNYTSHLKIEQRDLASITGSGSVPKSSTTSNWGYGVSSRYRFADAFAVKAAYEHSYRLPRANEYLGNGSTIYPNLRIKPENSDNINLGFFGTINLAHRHRLTYESGLFQRTVKDYIRLIISESEGMSQYHNVNNVTVKGIEGEVSYDYNRVFQAVANFTYLDERNKTKYQANGKPDISYNNRMPNRPWMYGNVELNFRKQNPFGKRDTQLKLSYYFQYSHWYYLTWKGYGSLSTKSTIPSQYINSALLTYSFKNERYNISVECKNLFDRTNYDNYMLQKPGRTFFCKLRLFIN